MASANIVAVPYAKAAFEFAKARKTQAKWAAVLNAAAEVVVRDDMRVLLNHPAIGQNDIAVSMIAAMGKSCDKYQANFFKILAEKQRLCVLPAIAQKFHLEQLADAAVLQATLTTADSITKKVLADIQTALKKSSGLDVEIIHEVDADLIGGAMIKMGDHVIDASLKGQLHRLAQQMIH